MGRPVARDYYAILGVTPTSEDVVIRAAYRALMRRYHPDADPTGEASEKAQAINAAYAVLSDPEKRARYDGSLAAQRLIKPDHSHPRRPRKRTRFMPVAVVGLAAVAAGAAFITMSPKGAIPPDALGLPEAARPHRAAVTNEPPSSVASGGLCGDAAVSGLLKAEILRRAASTGSARRDILEQAVVRVDSPAGKETGNDAAGCSAFVAIDLPPGTAVEGGRTNLNSEVSYGIAKSANGSLHLAGLSGDRRLVRSLATMAPFRPEQPADVDLIPPSRIALAEPERKAPQPKPQAKPVAVAAARPASPAAAAAHPSAPAPSQSAAGCRLGTGWAERAICNSGNLTALDRQLGLLYGQSWTRADEQKRAALSTSRDRFQERRGACRSESCLTTAYVARLREISDIMARRSAQ